MANKMRDSAYPDGVSQNHHRSPMTDEECARYLGPARAYCVTQFAYSGPYAARDGREQHINTDVQTAARENWLRAVVDTAYAQAREGYVTESEAIERANVWYTDGHKDGYTAAVAGSTRA